MSNVKMDTAPYTRKVVVYFSKIYIIYQAVFEKFFVFEKYPNIGNACVYYMYTIYYDGHIRIRCVHNSINLEFM